jgi:hypothetical protein
MLGKQTHTSAARWLARQLAAPGASVEPVVKRARKEPELVEALLESLEAAEAPLRYGSSKALWQLAKVDPKLLYPHFDFFLARVDHSNSVMRWNAARTLACLAPADAEGKVEAILDRYLSPISGPQMIMAGNVMAGAAEIATAKPALAERVAKAILGVDGARYQSDECRNIAAGHALTALTSIFPLLTNPEPALEFARKHLGNPRPATRKKAERFIKAAGKMGRGAASVSAT